ncbi:MAG: Rieske (2Fe-2S) protein [Acidimicrobiia bacterium]
MIEVGPVADVVKRRKSLVSHEGRDILVIASGESFHAFDNICVHRQRELFKGVVLNGKIVCPGHQWAFDLRTGYEAVKEECQPIYDTVVQDGVVFVDAASRRTHLAPPCAPAAIAEAVSAVEPVSAVERVEPVETSDSGSHA